MAKQKYKVVADREVLGSAPGSVIEADLTEEEEKLYIDGGFLTKSTAQSTSAADPVLTPAAQQAAEEEKAREAKQ